MMTKFSESLVVHTLKNGLTILVYPLHTIPRVASQIWYKVGSKNESLGQQGMAHFLEHMVFKGTKKLSEVDLIEITNKLSGECNAFTAHDYTAYVFDFPRQNWQVSLDLFADCMNNCTFIEDMINSELGAVMQELKLYRDDYASTLEEAMVGAFFEDHPYHHPIIGYKQDLWAMQQADMFNFYHRYYVVNNATLVIVGDVDPQDVIALAEQKFGDFQPNNDLSPQIIYQTKKDLVSKSMVVYRDIQQPLASVAFMVPGSHSKNHMNLDVLEWVLANGRASRLYKKLVADLQLVTLVEAYTYDMFEHSIFFVRYYPHKSSDCSTINKIIIEEMEALQKERISEHELQRATAQIKADYFAMFEDYESLASELGSGYLATGDPLYTLNYIYRDKNLVAADLQNIMQTYFHPRLVHTGAVLPLKSEDKNIWLALQEETDKYDAQALSNRERTTDLQPGMHVHTIVPARSSVYHAPQPQKVVTNNGSVLIYHHNDVLPMIDIVMEFKAQHYNDALEKQGRYNLMSAMLVEGTRRFTGKELADLLESRGMSLSVKPASISMSMLREDFGYGLEILSEIVQHPIFDATALDRVKGQVYGQIKEFWDEPSEYVGQLARQMIYQDHPYGRFVLGSIDSVEAITRDDLSACHHEFITPQETKIAIVGDLAGYDVPAMISKSLGSWQGPKVSPTLFPIIKQQPPQQAVYKANRDQIALCYAGLSIARGDSDYDAMLIFDEIFTGGAQGSMSSKLFRLREETGLFYTIRGSLLAYADKQPGMIIIRTLVSQEGLDLTQQKLEDLFDSVADEITQQDIEEAQEGLINNFTHFFASNKQMATTFLFIERFGLPADYFDKRVGQLRACDITMVKEAAKKHFIPDKLTVLVVGRL